MRDRLPPARALLDAGATVALASDANAGTFGAWGAMPLVIGLGSTLLGMSALEAVRAATIGGAAALGLAGERGQLAPAAVPTWWPGMPTMRARSPCTWARYGR